MGKWDFLIIIGGVAAAGLAVWIFKPEICKAIPKLPGLCVDPEQFFESIGEEEKDFDMSEDDVSLEGDMIGGQQQEPHYFCPEGMFFDHCGCKCVPDGSIVPMCYRQCPAPPAYVPPPGHISYKPVYTKDPVIAHDPRVIQACMLRCNSVPFAGGEQGNLECAARCHAEVLIRQGVF